MMTLLWPFRWLYLDFVHRELKGRYLGSISGLFWVLAQPLALLAVYSMVFEYIFKVKFPALEQHGYIVFIAVAMWPWLAFQESVHRGIMSILSGSSLVKKVSFPHELLVHSTVSASFLLHSIGFIVVLLILSLLGHDIHFLALPIVALLMLSMFILAIGVGLMLSALQVFIRDVEQIMQPLFMVWFYATPILYPVSIVPDQIKAIISWNPLTYYIVRIRELLLFEGDLLQIGDWIAILVSIAILLMGRWFFNRLSPHFEDYL
ncbi:MAG: ABC transporter permease [Mariprofundaceae bacterium]